MCVHMLKERKSEVCACVCVEGGQKDILSVRTLKWEEKKSSVCVCVCNKRGTIQYNFIAKCQYTDCTRTEYYVVYEFVHF